MTALKNIRNPSFSRGLYFEYIYTILCCLKKYVKQQNVPQRSHICKNKRLISYQSFVQLKKKMNKYDLDFKISSIYTLLLLSTFPI